MVKYIDGFVYEWNKNKEIIVFMERGVTFEQVLENIEQGAKTRVTPHRNTEKYPDQKVLYCSMNDYLWYIPFREEGNVRYLITIIPSKKFTKKYL